MNWKQLLEDVHAELGPTLGQGKVASYIPALAEADPQAFALALATNEGEIFTTGCADAPFSAQSITKVFMLGLALETSGEALWKRVGREPSGTPFNSIVQLEHEHGVPRNPFINAGALVAYSPPLNAAGNSLAGTEALERLAAHAGLNVFGGHRAG